MKTNTLSQTLIDLLDNLPESQGVTVNWMIEKTGGRGVYLLFIWLCLPFVLPVSLPGTSVVVGLILLLLCSSMLMGKVGKLP